MNEKTSPPLFTGPIKVYKKYKAKEDRDEKLERGSSALRKSKQE